MIDLSFVLRANTAAFTRGLAFANNSIKDVKKSLREFDVGNGLKQALGVGGVIAGFRAAITNARELRDEADKLGKTIDDGTRSVAELGDAIGRIGEGFKESLTDGLSFFTRIGDKARHFFQNVTADQEAAARKMVANTAKAAEEAEKRLKVSREANSPEKQAEAEAKLERTRQQSQVRGTDAQKKLVNLINEGADLEGQLAKLGKDTVAYKETQAALLKNEMSIKEASKDVDKESVEIQKKKKDDFQKNIADKYAPSVEQLAEMQTGGFTEANDPRLIAKKILQKEGFAAEAGSRGDIKGALKFGAEAQSMRKSLESQTGTGELLTAKNAETAFASALATTNKKLEDVEKALGGLIKAQ
jgi:hypothetical protein